MFDVTTGSYDEAKTCELVGLYLLNNINGEINGNFGLYRDDELGTVRSTPRQAERLKKQLCELFQKHQLKYL